MEESLPPLEEIDDYGPSFAKNSAHSTAMASTDDEFDVAALDDDIEVAAEQVVDEWADRLTRSDVFAGEEQQRDEDMYGEAEEMVGTMNDTLPAGGYDEVVMGYDGGNADDDDDDVDDRSKDELEAGEQEQGIEDEEDVFEEEEVVDDTGSFSEEIIDDTEMMDDGEIEEILGQAANVADNDEAGEANDVANPVEEQPENAEDEEEEPIDDGSVGSQVSGAFENRHELLSAPPAAPQRQQSDAQSDLGNNDECDTMGEEAGEEVQVSDEQVDNKHGDDEDGDDDGDEEGNSGNEEGNSGNEDGDDGDSDDDGGDEDRTDDDLEANIDSFVPTSIAQDEVGVHETKLHTTPEAPIDFAGTAHDNKAVESVVNTADLGRTKPNNNQVGGDLESGKAVASDVPASVEMDRRKNDANGDNDDVDDDDDGFLVCVLVVACLCCVLVVLAIVLPLVFLRKRGSGLSLAPSQSPVVAPSSMAPVTPTLSPPSVIVSWTQNVSSIMGAENSKFGSALALDGNFYVVGAPDHNRTGAVFTAYFEETWKLAIDPLLVGGTRNEGFGAALDILDGYLIVGAPSKIIANTTTPAGVAYVYVFDNGKKSWTKIGGKLKTAEGLYETNGEFGAAVAVGKAGDVPRVAVGAPRTSSSNALEVGRVYTYEVKGSPPSASSLNKDEPLFGKAASDLFGFSIDMTSDGERLIVGAPGDRATSSGYVHVFQWTGSKWTLEIEIPGSREGRFGSSVVCLSGRDDLYAIGAPNHDAGSGRVVVYQRKEGQYEQLGPAIIGMPGDLLGSKGSVNGGIDKNGDVLLFVATSTGDVKTFRHDQPTNTWIQNAVVVKTGHDKVQVEYSEEDGLLIADPDENIATLFGPDGSATIESLEIVSGPIPPPLLASLNSPTPVALEVSSAENPAASDLADWVLSEKDFSPPEADSDFGFSVSMTSSLMTIGAPATSGDTGAVLIYEKVRDEWIGAASARLTGGVIGGRFGASVYTTGRFLIVGAPNTVLAGTSTEIGAAYCYISSGGKWEQFGETLRGDTGIFGTDEQFGFAVGASNNGRILVGAPSSSVELLENRGRFYVFEYSTVESAWDLMLDVEGAAAADTLGYAVAMSVNGDRFVVGAPGGNYVFTYIYDGADWTLEDTLQADADEAFGSAVSYLSDVGDVLAVGSPTFDGGKGRVTVYRASATGSMDQLGSAIVGEVGESIGTTVGGNGDAPAVLVGTRTGLIKKFVFVESRNTWELDSLADSGFAGGVIALAVTNESNELAAGSLGTLAVYRQQQAP